MQLLNEPSKTFRFINLFLHYFFHSKICLIYFIFFFELFFIELSNNFFFIMAIFYICPWHSIFTFFNSKNLFALVLMINFYKNIFAFRNSYIMINFIFRIFIITFYTNVNLCTRLYINRYNFDCLIICVNPTLDG